MKYPRVGVTSGMRGWFAVLYDKIEPIQTGITCRDFEEAKQDAIVWAELEELPCDYTKDQ